MATVPFTPPINVAYCAAVRDALRVKLPTQKLEVYTKGLPGSVDLVVEARDGNKVANVTLRVG